MSTKSPWDFECPQYVDFRADLDSSGKDDVFFDCTDHQTPTDDLICKTPVKSKELFTASEVETKLLDHMDNALSLLTPKGKKSAVKAKILSENFPVGFQSKVTKSTFKFNTLPASRVKLHRSKSIARLNKIVSGNASNARVCGLRKSSSLNDLQTARKKKYPTTPMCLKRTIVKAKEKIKSSEEMELEQIARMQKQLIQHLRYNEMTLKKLKLNPRPFVIPRTQAKSEHAEENQGLNAAMEKSNIVLKGTRRNIQTMNHAAIKNEALKLDRIINNQPVSRKTIDNQVNSRKSKNPSVSSEVNEKNMLLGTRKHVGHSGLVFHVSSKKNTLIKPFSFQSKIKETKPQNVDSKQHKIAALLSKTCDDKENICIKQQSTVKKGKEVQIAKCDTNKLDTSKIVGKRFLNPLKGAPLSENFARN